MGYDNHAWYRDVVFSILITPAALILLTPVTFRSEYHVILFQSIDPAQPPL